jgi:hypothetical protein
MYCSVTTDSWKVAFDRGVVAHKGMYRPAACGTASGSNPYIANRCCDEDKWLVLRSVVPAIIIVGAAEVGRRRLLVASSS